MTFETRLFIGIGSACIALGASAQVPGNGSTGYIGLSASAQQSHADGAARQVARAGAMEHPRAGEADTIHDGRPMMRMQAERAAEGGSTASRRMDLQRMGGSPARSALVPGGTPD